MSDYENPYGFLGCPRGPSIELKVDFSRMSLSSPNGFMRVPENCFISCVEISTSTRRWQFPRDPFIIYEATDEQWARPLGFGREVETELKIDIPRARVFPKGYEIVIHPEQPDLFRHVAELTV